MLGLLSIKIIATSQKGTNISGTGINSQYSTQVGTFPDTEIRYPITSDTLLGITIMVSFRYLHYILKKHDTTSTVLTNFPDPVDLTHLRVGDPINSYL